MAFYQTPADCKFFTPDSKALDPYPLPLGEIEFERAGDLLRIRHRHRLYVLGIAANGTLLGFRGTLRADSLADLVVLKTGPFSFGIFERRHANEEQLEAALAEFTDASLAAGAYSCGYLDYQRNLDGFQGTAVPAGGLSSPYDQFAPYQPQGPAVFHGASGWLG